MQFSNASSAPSVSSVPWHSHHFCISDPRYALLIHFSFVSALFVLGSPSFEISLFWFMIRFHILLYIGATLALPLCMDILTIQSHWPTIMSLMQLSYLIYVHAIHFSWISLVIFSNTNFAVVNIAVLQASSISYMSGALLWGTWYI